MSDEKRTIACCPECEKPAISTMMIGGAEWFCMNCKWSGGVLYEKTLEWTQELQDDYNRLKAEFDEARKGFQPGGCTMSGCKKCERQEENNDRYHIWHLTDKEKTDHYAAKEKLFGKQKEEA